jgi:hypothetical protein
MGSHKSSSSKKSSSSSNGSRSTSGDICRLLRSLPINYPVDNVILQGQDEAVTNFLAFDDATEVAIFRNGAATKVFDCSKVTGLDF